MIPRVLVKDSYIGLWLVALLLLTRLSGVTRDECWGCISGHARNIEAEGVAIVLCHWDNRVARKKLKSVCMNLYVISCHHIWHRPELREKKGNSFCLINENVFSAHSIQASVSLFLLFI